MAAGGIEWEAGRYGRAQEVLQQSAEFCSAHPTWRLNLAHAILAQEGRLQARAAGCRARRGCMRLQRSGSGWCWRQKPGVVVLWRP